MNRWRGEKSMASSKSDKCRCKNVI